MLKKLIKGIGKNLRLLTGKPDNISTGIRIDGVGLIKGE